jgi:hypothetical protein
MKLVANSVPKSGTHLLDRLLILLRVELVNFGGIKPHPVGDGRFPLVHRRLRALLGLRKPEDVMGIGSYLVEGGLFPPARKLVRVWGPEKVTVGVDFPQQISRRWLGQRLARVADGQFITAHCIYTPQLADLFREKGMKTVSILRDPRDVAVSQLHYIKRLKQHPIHEAFVALPSDHERLLFSIRGGTLGGRQMLSLDERYRRFSGWAKDEGSVVVKFEDLVGPEGGGSAEAQRRAVGRVAKHLGLEADEEMLSAVGENIFGAGQTFRKGQIGGWREEFSAEHERAAAEVVGPLLVELGYESGLG